MPSNGEHEDNMRRMRDLLRKVKEEIKAEGDDPIDWVMMKRAIHWKRMTTLTNCIERGLWNKDWELWENEISVQHGEAEE